MELKKPRYVDHTIGHCPKCGHLINLVGCVAGKVVHPDEISESDAGCIHCGDCGLLLIWGPKKAPLRAASEEEIKSIIQDVGEENWKKVLQQVKDKRAFKDGLL